MANVKSANERSVRRSICLPPAVAAELDRMRADEPEVSASAITVRVLRAGLEAMRAGRAGASGLAEAIDRRVAVEAQREAVVLAARIMRAERARR